MISKKELLNKINGKKVRIKNVEDIKKEIEERKKALEKDIQDHNKIHNTDLAIKEYKDGFYILTNGQSIREPFYKALEVHNRELKSEVRSKDVVINGCYFNISDIVVLSETTFTSKNKISDNIDIIFEIVE